MALELFEPAIRKWSITMIRLSFLNFSNDQTGIMALEKAITQGKPVLVADIKERLNNVAMPLIYHYNTLNEDHLDKGKLNL